jgi:arylsulfatase
MLVDNLGYGELGCYGGGATRGAPTPRIDRLASEGLRLTNMNMEAQCTPSRSAILTGRYAIRSGTHSVPFGGVADGLTQWEVTMAESLSGRRLRDGALRQMASRQQQRSPAERSRVSTSGRHSPHDRRSPLAGLAGYSPSIMPPEQLMEGRKGEQSRNVRIYDLEQRRLIDAEITRRSIAFMERQVQAKKPFFAYATADAAASADRCPTRRSPARLATETGPICSPRWITTSARCSTRSIGSASVMTPSSSSPATTARNSSGLGRLGGAMERPILHGLGRRHPRALHDPVAGKGTAGRVSDEIVHAVDLFPTLANLAGASVPSDRPIDGVDQSGFFLGKTEKSAREGILYGAPTACRP